MSGNVGGTPVGEDSAQDGKKIDASSEGCDTCPFRSVGFCAAVMGASLGEGERRKTAGSALARQQILRPGEASGRVIVLRQGWALRSAITSDGRRQVLSILLPGDIAGGEFLMRDKVRVPVQSLTPVEYCSFDVTYLKEIAGENPAFIWTFVDLCLSSKEASEARLIDLGRRNAEQRLARLILDLHRRLREKGLSNGATIPFPLRQQTVADALGLTQVHVSRVIRSLRQSRILQIRSGQLTILDMDALMATAEFYET